MADTEYGSKYSEHGKARYEILQSTLSAANYKMNSAKVLDLLKSVAQGPEKEELFTGFTQWSEVYDLTKKKVKMSILREFDKSFEFSIE